MATQQRAAASQGGSKITQGTNGIRGSQLQYSDFELKATVGTGTFGRVRVVMVKGSSDRTPMALKILKKAKVIKLKQVEHVKAEMQLLSMIDHPFIVNLLSTFQDETRLFMLMEFVNGGELFSVIRKQRHLKDDHAKFYAAEVTLAFEYLHSMNIAYRDLKPENTLVDADGHMKITDFGFAKVVEDRTWTLCGTPEYLAPEIIQMKGHGPAVDWWALGILIYEMLAGYAPFFDNSAMGIYQKVIAGVVNFPSHFDAKPKDLITRLLKEKSKRLGCLKDGPADIKNHKWFKTLNFEEVLERKVRAPYLPKVKSAEDTSQFDRYPESNDHGGPPLSEKDQALFNIDSYTRTKRRSSSVFSV